MAGPVTLTEESQTVAPLASSAPIRLIKWEWTSDASGDATKATSLEYQGILAAVTTDPDAGDAPTADYDVVINDDNGLDVAGGALADRHTSNTETVKDNAAFTYFSSSVLTLVVSNAGNVKKGIVYAWIKMP